MKIKLELKEIDFKDPIISIGLRHKISPYAAGIITGHLVQGELIPAVKLIKEITGLSLKESKDILDEMRSKIDKIYGGTK